MNFKITSAQKAKFALISGSFLLMVSFQNCANSVKFQSASGLQSKADGTVPLVDGSGNGVDGEPVTGGVVDVDGNTNPMNGDVNRGPASNSGSTGSGSTGSSSGSVVEVCNDPLDCPMTAGGGSGGTGGGSTVGGSTGSVGSNPGSSNNPPPTDSTGGVVGGGSSSGGVSTGEHEDEDDSLDCDRKLIGKKIVLKRFSHNGVEFQEQHLPSHHHFFFNIKRRMSDRVYAGGAVSLSFEGQSFCGNLKVDIDMKADLTQLQGSIVMPGYFVNFVPTGGITADAKFQNFCRGKSTSDFVDVKKDYMVKSILTRKHRLECPGNKVKVIVDKDNNSDIYGEAEFEIQHHDESQTSADHDTHKAKDGGSCDRKS